ncbi:MAG TPA: hypothetical protein VH859_03755 [Candidatus Limnocylindria bacterium]|jgi:hypothetical protein
MAAARPVIHLPLLAGACAAAYAVSLAFVTGQQAAADAALRATREPLRHAVTDAAQERLRAVVAVRRAAARLERAGGAYRRTLEASADLDAYLAALAEEVAVVTGAAAALPDRVALPAPQIQVVQVTSAPPVQAVSGGSGR